MRKAAEIEAGVLVDTLFEAFENASIGVVVTLKRPEGHSERVYVNDAFARIAGRTREELLAGPAGEIADAPTREEVERIRARVNAGGKVPPTLEAAITRPDGTRVPIHVGLASATWKGAPVAVAFIQDRTHARAAQEALEASEGRFRTLAEAAPDSIVVIAAGRVVYANPNAIRVLGFDDLADFLARPLAELVAPEEVPLMGERVQRVLRGERLPPLEYHGRRKDGSIVVMEISSVATTWEGHPAVIGFGRDVSERKVLVQRMLKQDRLAAVGTLAAGVAHEINNPLSYALLNLQMLRLRAGPLSAAGSPEARQIDQALEGLERVRRIVQDLLSFARPSAEVVEPVDVSQVVGAAVRLARTTTDRTARIEVAVDGLPLVQTNGARLGQVLLNVLVNALQALEGRTDGLVRVTGSACASRLRLEVRDNGSGIPATLLAKVFDPFFTTKPPGKGTGLGLSVSQSIMTSLGGALEVVSEEGDGTLVRLELPLGATEPGEPADRRARVLVVDDDPYVASSLVAFLEDDHDAVPCTDVDAALDVLCGEERWDVVLCDVRMPRMSGPEVLLRVRERRPELARRFVFVTGGVLPPGEARVVAEMGCRVLAKPLALEDLVRTIAAVAGAR
ncbi:MAG: PAS domain-containing hybrid sensor histidine kinase/response regulator [Myxococcota bacterium]